MAERTSSTTKAGQRALVVGVSDYPAPLTKLPAVANDVREMAKVIGSKNGAFSKGDVIVLSDKQATRQQILDGLQTTLAGASLDETVFVYLAGHGGVEGNEFFFAAHDTNGGDLATTGVPLDEIKTLFDKTKSRRVLLWLDFCHSGGILARSASADDMEAISRALDVVKGHGKVIVAACTSSQSAYECATIGHGLFTDALLRGLKGEAKNAKGEVTALSLYEYIDHEVSAPRQQPVLFGKISGRIVLMYYDAHVGTGTKKKAKAPPTRTKARPKKKTGTWIMLGDNFFLAQNVRHQSAGTLQVGVVPEDGEQEAALAALRPTQYGGRETLPFAVNNDAHLIHVDQVTTDTTGGSQHWTLSLTVEDGNSNSMMTEVTYNGISPDEMAKRRAGRILINDPPPTPARRGYHDDSMIEGFIEGSMSRYPTKECVVRSAYQQYGASTNWKDFARLKSVFLLKMSGTVEHVIELSIGAVRNKKVEIEFRGRRPRRYTNVDPETIEITGVCELE